MDKKQNAVGRRAAQSTTTLHHENTFSNWVKAVQLSVLEFVGRWRISGHDEIQHHHLKLRSTFQHSLTGDANDYQSNARHICRHLIGRLSCARHARVDASKIRSTTK